MSPGRLQTMAVNAVAAEPGAAALSLRTQRLLLTGWLVASDGFALLAAFRIAYWIRFELQLTVAPDVLASIDAYWRLTLFLVPLWLLLFAVHSLYDSHGPRGGIQESSRIFNACTTSTMLVVVATFLAPQFVVARGWLVSVWLLSFGLVAANRFASRRLVYALRSRGYLLRAAVIVGTNEEATSLATYLSDRRSSGVRLAGFVAAAAPDRRQATPLLGHVHDIAAIVTRHAVEDVIVAITDPPRQDLLRLCEELNGLPVQLRLSSGVYELLTTRVEVRALGTVPLMSVQKARLDPVEAAVKGTIDLLIGIVGLLLLAPLLAAIALWIKIDSPGPVLYRRRVLGVFGRPFDAYKFRTMYVDGADRLRACAGAAERLQAEHKLKDDPRVTKAGRWLRRYSLDELPQLVNVVRGQMGLVGPRMITPAEAAMYGRLRLNLLSVKPGLTGLWQVSGRSDLSYDQRMRLDMYYVRNYSIWLDLQILLVETLPAVLRGRGAY